MIVIGIFFIGVLLGTFGKRYYKLFTYSEILTSLSLYSLLLFLGLSIGRNSSIVNNMTNLGVQGLLFALASSLGSILLILPLYYLFPKRKKDE